MEQGVILDSFWQDSLGQQSGPHQIAAAGTWIQAALGWN